MSINRCRGERVGDMVSRHCTRRRDNRLSIFDDIEKLMLTRSENPGARVFTQRRLRQGLVALRPSWSPDQVPGPDLAASFLPLRGVRILGCRRCEIQRAAHRLVGRGFESAHHYNPRFVFLSARPFSGSVGGRPAHGGFVHWPRPVKFPRLSPAVPPSLRSPGRYARQP